MGSLGISGSYLGVIEYAYEKTRLFPTKTVKMFYFHRHSTDSSSARKSFITVTYYQIFKKLD